MKTGLGGGSLSEEVNAGVSSEKSVGGIDLDTRNLEIKTIGDGAGFEFSFDMSGYENMLIVGFSPVIIQIVPIANAAIFIGQ